MDIFKTDMTLEDSIKLEVYHVAIQLRVKPKILRTHPYRILPMVLMIDGKRVWRIIWKRKAPPGVATQGKRGERSTDIAALFYMDHLDA